VELASGRELELVWRNDLGGLTFRFVDPFVKWNPRSTGIDLDRERVRLEWISARQPAPRVLDSGSDVSAQWLLLTALPGECAVGDLWRTRRAEAIRATATGLRALHAIPITDFPERWTSEGWVGQRPNRLGLCRQSASLCSCMGTGAPQQHSSPSRGVGRPCRPRRSGGWGQVGRLGDRIAESDRSRMLLRCCHSPRPPRDQRASTAPRPVHMPVNDIAISGGRTTSRMSFPAA